MSEIQCALCDSDIYDTEYKINDWLTISNRCEECKNIVCLDCISLCDICAFYDKINVMCYDCDFMFNRHNEIQHHKCESCGNIFGFCSDHLLDADDMIICSKCSDKNKNNYSIMRPAY